MKRTMPEASLPSAQSVNTCTRGTRSLGRRPLAAILAGTVALISNLWVAPALADPFRAGSPHSIGDRTEAAFDTLFKQGNYRQASEILRSAESNEPLAYAMQASLAYLNEDWDVMGENARRTRETAEQLLRSDPLRGHLYVAAGHFLEGAYTLKTEGTVAATPGVLAKLQQVFDNLNRAEQIAPDDPELNLLKGYMELMLAVNLPFSDPNQAIQRLQQYGSPSYLVYRGMAIGFRDLDQFQQAHNAIDLAISETPDNPDLYYLKAQIFVQEGKDQESLPYFLTALEKENQLPQRLANQLAWEHCRAENRVERIPDQQSRDECRPLRRRG